MYSPLLKRKPCKTQSESPNSPDLNPAASKVWGVMQHGVYQTKVNDLDELERRLTDVWAGIQQSLIDDAIKQRRKRLRICVQTGCVHFEHLLWVPTSVRLSESLFTPLARAF